MGVGWMEGVHARNEGFFVDRNKAWTRDVPGKTDVPPFTQGGSEAYVTLLYGDKFLSGVRVLGQSLRETGTAKDLVCIVTAASEEAVNTLKEDGWKTYTTETILNPSKVPGYVTPARFWAVYTKLVIFKLPYRKVVYLDADTIVLKNIDELFECGGKSGFCANLKHSEHMNTGVIVVSPDENMFSDMMQQIQSTSSYDGGDQGFLDSYFAGFADAPLFVPSGKVDTHDSEENILSTRQTDFKLQRLRTCYNADVGLYIFNSERWSVPEDSLKVIHYTLGPIKPWDWWSSWLVKPAAIWRMTYERLRPTPFDTWLVAYTLFLLLLPVCFVIASCIYMNCGKEAKKFPCCMGKAHRYPALASFIASFPGEVTLAVGFCSLVLSFSIPVLILVPRQVAPAFGWILVYEWGLLCFGTIMYHWLLLCYGTGAFHQEHSYTGTGNSKCKYISEASGRKGLVWKSAPIAIALVLALMLVPFVPTFISQFVVKLIVLGVGIAIVTAVLAYSFVTLGITWYQHGLVATRTKEREMNGEEEKGVGYYRSIQFSGMST